MLAGSGQGDGEDHDQGGRFVVSLPAGPSQCTCPCSVNKEEILLAGYPAAAQASPSPLEV